MPRTYPILYVLFTYIVTISVAVLGILGSLMAMEGLKSLLTAPTIFTGFSSFLHDIVVKMNEIWVRLSEGGLVVNWRQITSLITLAGEFSAALRGTTEG